MYIYIYIYDKHRIAFSSSPSVFRTPPLVYSFFFGKLLLFLLLFLLLLLLLLLLPLLFGNLITYCFSDVVFLWTYPEEVGQPPPRQRLGWTPPIHRGSVSVRSSAVGALRAHERATRAPQPCAGHMCVYIYIYIHMYYIYIYILYICIYMYNIYICIVYIYIYIYMHQA